jgi:hypothetical protein
MTQERASTMLDLPEPFGPTTQVMPGSRRSVVAEAKDLKPRSVRVFRYTAAHLPRICPDELLVNLTVSSADNVGRGNFR